jgi:hypothetical protein
MMSSSYTHSYRRPLEAGFRKRAELEILNCD